MDAAVRPPGGGAASRGCSDSGWDVGPHAAGAFRSRRRQPLQRPPRAGVWKRSPSVSVGRGWGLGLLLTESASFRDVLTLTLGAWDGPTPRHAGTCSRLRQGLGELETVGWGDVGDAGTLACTRGILRSGCSQLDVDTSRSSLGS